jgi:inorganic pyrophosphatase
MKKAKAAMKRSTGQTEQAGIVIETPRGSRNKMKYDPQSRMYKLSKILPEGMVFPYDFGFVPGTKGDDGDPLDVLVLTDEALFPGCLVDCVLVGVLELEQRENGKTERNDRLIAVAQASLLYCEITDLANLNPTVLKQIEAFFVNYQTVRGIEVKVLGRSGPERAREILRGGSTSRRTTASRRRPR